MRERANADDPPNDGAIPLDFPRCGAGYARVRSSPVGKPDLFRKGTARRAGGAAHSSIPARGANTEPELALRSLSRGLRETLAKGGGRVLAAHRSVPRWPGVSSIQQLPSAEEALRFGQACAVSCSTGEVTGLELP
jgi:hypothetical protein